MIKIGSTQKAGVLHIILSPQRQSIRQPGSGEQLFLKTD